MIPVKEVMTRNVITFREDTPVEEVAQTLATKRITGAPVLGGDGHVVGIVSEVDVFSKKGKLARDIMSTHVISVAMPRTRSTRCVAGWSPRRDSPSSAV